jgi:hypothetical protein
LKTGLHCLLRGLTESIRELATGLGEHADKVFDADPLQLFVPVLADLRTRNLLPLG